MVTIGRAPDLCVRCDSFNVVGTVRGVGPLCSQDMALVLMEKGLTGPAADPEVQPHQVDEEHWLALLQHAVRDGDLEQMQFCLDAAERLGHDPKRLFSRL